jgi:S1-C subfamily serine protease
MHHVRIIALLSIFLFGLQSRSATTNIAALSYAEVKQMFEKDESVAEVRVNSFSTNEVSLLYKGRYLTYKLGGLSGPLRTKLDGLIEAEKAKRREQAIKNNEEAARLGLLREVNGVVHNLAKPSAAWKTFKDVRVIQKTDDALLVHIGGSGYDMELIYVLNAPQYRQVADGDKITFTALQTGTHTYITRSGDDKTVRQYDCGTAPGKSKKPSMVRSPTPGSDKSGLGREWDSSGTGFFVSSNGYLVTCSHVVANASRIAIQTRESILEAKVVADDPTNDIAVLKVEGQFAAIPISTNAVRLGDSIFTIGFPNIDIQGMAPKYTDGKISSLSGVGDEAGSMQISVPVQPGNSGGPLTDVNGAVVGVVVSRLSDFAVIRQTRTVPQNVNYAVKAELISKLLKRNGIRAIAAATKPTASSQEAVAMVEKATAIVLVKN